MGAYKKAVGFGGAVHAPDLTAVRMSEKHQDSLGGTINNGFVKRAKNTPYSGEYDTLDRGFNETTHSLTDYRHWLGIPFTGCNLEGL